MKFRTAPVIMNYKIPFDLDEQPFMDWLKLLSLEQSYFSCKELFCVLQALIKIPIGIDKHLFFLEKMSSNLDDLAGMLENKYLYESFPLDNKAQASLDMVTFSYAMLAENYSALGHQLQGRNDAINQQQALYLALRAAGKSLLCMAQGYMNPYEGFWLFCYHVYAFAEQHKLLNLEVINNDDAPGNTIETAFNQIVLFDRVDTNQFNPQEMKVIHAVLQVFANQAVISKKYDQDSIKGLFVFNLSEDKPPKELTQFVPYKDPADRYLSPLPVAKSLYRLIQSKSPLINPLISENRHLCFRIVKTLSASQKRKYTRIAEHRLMEHRHGLGIIGFDNVSYFLHRKDDFVNNQKNDTPVLGNWRAPDLNYPEGGEAWLETMMDMSFTDALTINKSLKPMPVAAQGKGVRSLLGTKNIADSEIIPVGEFEVINSSAQGLHTSWQTVNLKVKIGDIFAIPSDQDDRVAIGLIRRINRETYENVRLSIELVTFECEPVYLVRQGQQNSLCGAILLSGIEVLKQKDSIICKKDDFFANETYCMIRGKEQRVCQLTKALNLTASICHAELNYLDENT